MICAVSSISWMFERILPPGGVRRAWGIVISQTVNETNVRVAHEQCLEIYGGTSANILERYNLQLGKKPLYFWWCLGLNCTHHNILATFSSARRLIKHAE